MKILLNKTHLPFDLTWEAVNAIRSRCGWEEMDVIFMCEGDLDLRSDSEFIKVIEEFGSKAFKKCSKDYQRYEIIDVDIPENEIKDYFIDNVDNGNERILKVTKYKTLKKINGES